MDTAPNTTPRVVIGEKRAKNILDYAIDLVESIPGSDPSQKIADNLREFRDLWFDPMVAGISAIVLMLPSPLEEMGGDLPSAIQTLVARLQAAERDLATARATEPAAQSPNDPGHGPCIMRIRNVIRKWQAAGVSNAMETAPARLTEIETIIRDHLFAEGEEVPHTIGGE